jgi:hypothetical protein
MDYFQLNEFFDYEMMKETIRQAQGLGRGSEAEGDLFPLIDETCLYRILWIKCKGRSSSKEVERTLVALNLIGLKINERALKGVENIIKNSKQVSLGPIEKIRDRELIKALVSIWEIYRKERSTIPKRLPTRIRERAESLEGLERSRERLKRLMVKNLIGVWKDLGKKMGTAEYMVKSAPEDIREFLIREVLRESVCLTESGEEVPYRDYDIKPERLNLSKTLEYIGKRFQISSWVPIESDKGPRKIIGARGEIVLTKDMEIIKGKTGLYIGKRQSKRIWPRSFDELEGVSLLREIYKGIGFERREFMTYREAETRVLDLIPWGFSQSTGLWVGAIASRLYRGKEMDLKRSLYRALMDRSPRGISSYHPVLKRVSLDYWKDITRTQRDKSENIREYGAVVGFDIDGRTYGGVEPIEIRQDLMRSENLKNRLKGIFG